MTQEIERLVEPIALAIERADNEQVPDYPATLCDHPEVSDWGIHLALAVLQSDALTALIKREEELREALFWIIGNSDLTSEVNRRARAAYFKNDPAALNPKTESE